MFLFCVMIRNLLSLNSLSTLPVSSVDELFDTHLGRAWIAALLRRPDKQANFRELYGDLLTPVSRGDVVFGDPITTWPVPSFGTRVR